MSEIIRIAANVGTPLALLGLLAALAYFAYVRHLKYQEKKLEALPPEERATRTDAFLTRYGIKLAANLPAAQKVELIKDEMNKRHRFAVICVVALIVAFVVCFSVAVFSRPSGAATEPRPSDKSEMNDAPAKPPISIVGTQTAFDENGFPLLQFTLRNNSRDSQVIVGVDVECVHYVAYGGGSQIKTRPLVPMAVWDLVLTDRELWSEREDGKWTKPISKNSSLIPNPEKLPIQPEFRAWHEFRFTPPAPLLIAADDAATIRIRVAEPRLSEWPSALQIPQPDRESRPEYPRVPTNPPYWILLKFVSDRGAVAESERFDMQNWHFHEKEKSK